MILDDLLARLAAVEPAPVPFLSLYVNAQPDQHGRPRYETFVRKELPARAASYPVRSPERTSIDRDAERIRQYLAHDLRPAANGAALFACAGADDFFQTVQLEAPIDGHQLFVSSTPYVYPLARINDQYGRFATLVADSHTARLFVFEAGARIEDLHLAHPKVRRSAGGGSAQARYQRHLEHEQLHRAKAASEALKRVVLERQVERIVLAGDDVIMPVIRDQLPKYVAERVAAVLRLDIRTPEGQILQASLDALRESDVREDAERVTRLRDAHRGHGLGVVGARATRAALDRGQVAELILTALPDHPAAEPTEAERIADGLVRAALRSAARLTFVEDSTLLADVEGVGALLRYAA